MHDPRSMAPHRETTIYLVRHATIDGADRLVGRTRHVSLNARGREEAQRLARSFSHLAIAAIYTSPQQRTVETARAIQAATNAPLHVEPAFDELDFGRWTGRTFMDLQTDPAWRRFNEQRHDAVVPQGERMADVMARIRRGLASIGVAHPGAAAVVVTHAEIVRCAVLAAAGRSLDEWPSVDIAPASVKTLVENEAGNLFCSS